MDIDIHPPSTPKRPALLAPIQHAVQADAPIVEMPKVENELVEHSPPDPTEGIDEEEDDLPEIPYHPASEPKGHSLPDLTEAMDDTGEPSSDDSNRFPRPLHQAQQSAHSDNGKKSGTALQLTRKIAKIRLGPKKPRVTVHSTTAIANGSPQQGPSRLAKAGLQKKLDRPKAKKLTNVSHGDRRNTFSPGRPQTAEANSTVPSGKIYIMLSFQFTSAHTLQAMLIS